jgi:hypothetical protein
MIAFFKDKKNLVILLLGALFIIKIPGEGLRFAFWVLAGIFLCCALDFLINRFFLKKRVFPNSAIISGFILSGILDYWQPWFILVTFSLSAIISKHVIKFNHRHIFNPANFTLFFATLFRIPLTWNIESHIFLIIIFGIYLAYSYKKISHILGFLIFFIGAFAVFKTNAAGLISWFFVFIMLPEPKTSGYGVFRGFIFGSIAGTTCFLMLRFIPGIDPFVSCLFIANLSRSRIPLTKPLRGIN